MSDSRRDALSRLGERRDGPALVHLLLQSAALIASAAISAVLASRGHAAWWVAAFACGVAVLSFFPLLHETGHQTAFRSKALNEVGVWLGALMMLQAPSFFREFHWEHHRSTQLPDADPEISGAPAILDGYPRDPFSYLFLVSGQFLMVGKLGFTLACALLPTALWSRLFPFIRTQHQRRVAWESRAALLVLAAFVGLGLHFVPGFWAILSAWPIAHLLLGFYLMPEHTGLPNTGSQVERTRTVYSNAWLRSLMWNMPYHAEHHAHPGIPYHALPALHREMSAELCHTSRSYLSFHADALARALRLR